MRKAVLVLIPFCLAMAALAYAGDTVIEEIVARVNNAIVTRGDLQRAKTQTLQELKQQMPEAQATAQFANSEKDVLRDLIDRELILQKAQDLGLSADTEVIKRLDDIRKQMKLDTMEDMEKAAAAQGISYEDFKQNIKNEILYRKVVQQEVGGHLTITPDEEKQFYEAHKKELDRPEAVRLSEILISTEPKVVKDADGKEQRVERTPEEIAAAEAKAKDVLAQLNKGAKFDDLAKKYSDGPTAAQGGDLDYFERGKLNKSLEDVAFALKPGAHSDIIQTQQGFLIMQVTDHVQAGIPPLKDVEGQVQQAIYMEKLQPELRKYLTKLREDAYIDIKPGYVDTGASPNESKPVLTNAAQPAGAKEKLKRKKHFLLF